MVLSILMSFILIGLGGIHFYWAFGGQLGFAATLPTKENGQKVLNPKMSHCLIAGFVFLLFGFLYLIQSGLIVFEGKASILAYAGWIIPTIFIARAVGDFKYVGFFKSVKETNFGKIDSQLYSPLSLTIGLLGILTQLLQQC